MNRRLLHYVVRYRRSGLALDDALVQASLVRVRPILMTTFAAVFALLPLALKPGNGTQMQQPLAIAVIGGVRSRPCCCSSLCPWCSG